MTPPPALPAKKTRASAKSKRAAARECVVGYLRVSTEEQAGSGLGIDAQRSAIEAACTAKGWSVAAWFTDEAVSGSVPPEDRPAMSEALAMLDACEAGALVAAKVDRIARDLHDLTGLLRRAERDGWAVVALDLGVDTSTPVGRLVAGIMGGVAEWERSVIRDRTKAALQAKKAKGLRLGAPITTPDAVRQRIRALDAESTPMQAIADALNDEGLTTATGLPWTAGNVRRVTVSLRLDDAQATAARKAP